ncbi:hypothetical protein MMC17_009869, partial [Xylographa soralifera]|nr:hypothetical protein [Xylographa soralifera]
MDALPDELLDLILCKLPRLTQAQISLSSRRLSSLITPYLYHTVELVDRRNDATLDQHDDTPMLQMLLLLIRRPHLASYVRDLSYRCHENLPD